MGVWRQTGKERISSAAGSAPGLTQEQVVEHDSISVDAGLLPGKFPFLSLDRVAPGVKRSNSIPR